MITLLLRIIRSFLSLFLKKEEKEQHISKVSSVAYSPNGRYFASGLGDGTIIVWNTKSGKRLYTLKGHTDVVKSVAFSPDGAYLVSGSWDGTIIVWDIASGERLHTLKEYVENGFNMRSPWPRRIYAVALSPDERYLASGLGNGMVIVWDMESGERLYALAASHTSAISSLAFSPDGAYLASGSWGNVIVWNAKSGERLHTFKL